MATDASAPQAAPEPSAYLEVQQSTEFAGLRKALRRFAFPMTVAFLVWYALYVILSVYARGFMSTRLFGNVNVALIFGLLQFVTTFLIAWRYVVYADRNLDPVAAELRNRLESSTPTAPRPRSGVDAAPGPRDGVDAARTPAEEGDAR